jgi:hypothetical protein
VKLLAIALAALVVVPAASAASQAQQLQKSESVVRFFTGSRHGWMIARHQEHCWTVPWQRTCRIARRVLERHRGRVLELRRVLWRTLPAVNDWRTAVTLAQRVYPGTEPWLLYISDREGGWGPFVMNHQGSGAGGWLQFMASTFYAYVDDARASFERRGFKVDPRVWTWTHPLGQALTGAYMRFTGRDGCHWCL